MIGSFCVYIDFLRARFEVPGRPLGPALRSFCLSLWSLGLSLGRLGAQLGCLGTHFGAPGVALGCLGDALGPLWDTLGSMLGCLGITLVILDIWCPQEPPPQANGSEVPRLRPAVTHPAGSCAPLSAVHGCCVDSMRGRAAIVRSGIPTVRWTSGGNEFSHGRAWGRFYWQITLRYEPHHPRRRVVEVCRRGSPSRSPRSRVQAPVCAATLHGYDDGPQLAKRRSLRQFPGGGDSGITETFLRE